MPSLIIALAAVIGVAFGWGVRVVSGRAVTLVFAAITAAAALAVWIAARNPYFLLPFAGVLVGLFYRRQEFVSLFDRK